MSSFISSIYNIDLSLPLPTFFGEFKKISSKTLYEWIFSSLTYRTCEQKKNFIAMKQNKTDLQSSDMQTSSDPINLTAK